MNVPPRGQNAGAVARVALAPLEQTSTFADRAYAALKDVILSLDIYARPGEVRLDERALANDLGISRTPVREAMVQLEREGFLRSVPRRGVYVVRKTKVEVIELITAWAALESMAARLITQHASDEEIAQLRAMFATFEDGRLHAKLDEYSEVNIEFHQMIIRMSRNGVLIDLAANLFAHMRMIRRKTIGEEDRADRSISDHMNIIQALEARDTARAEELVRNHALGLAEHVARHAHYLDKAEAGSRGKLVPEPQKNDPSEAHPLTRSGLRPSHPLPLPPEPNGSISKLWREGEREEEAHAIAGASEGEGVGKPDSTDL